jgi:hypothetical protein
MSANVCHSARIPILRDNNLNKQSLSTYLKVRYYTEEVGIDGTVILREMLQKQVVKLQNKFLLTRLAAMAGFYEHNYIEGGNLFR